VTTESSAQAARSNIQAGISSHRVASEPLSVQRKTTSSGLATAWWTKTDRPNHGCHRYKSSRKPVPWVLSSWVVQSPTASLIAEIPNPRGLCRPPHRNGRSAAQPRPAPPIVRCSTRATWRTKLRDSNRRWMKTQWQVSSFKPRKRLEARSTLYSPIRDCDPARLMRLAEYLGSVEELARPLGLESGTLAS
jgi:hypothetical protein